MPYRIVSDVGLNIDFATGQSQIFLVLSDIDFFLRINAFTALHVMLDRRNPLVDLPISPLEISLPPESDIEWESRATPAWRRLPCSPCPVRRKRPARRSSRACHSLWPCTSLWPPWSRATSGSRCWRSRISCWSMWWSSCRWWSRSWDCSWWFCWSAPSSHPECESWKGVVFCSRCQRFSCKENVVTYTSQRHLQRQTDDQQHGQSPHYCETTRYLFWGAGTESDSKSDTTAQFIHSRLITCMVKPSLNYSDEFLDRNFRWAYNYCNNHPASQQTHYFV